MILRLMIDVQADDTTVQALREWVECRQRVTVDPQDGKGLLSGHLMGAVPVEDPREAQRLAAEQNWTDRADATLGGY